ncbi:MAG: hypothetical protein IKK23_03280, partial [Bacteroidales bacterium]|nr:hypothetical protein [Bacteroidales bacterium]
INNLILICPIEEGAHLFEDTAHIVLSTRFDITGFRIVLEYPGIRLDILIFVLNIVIQIIQYFFGLGFPDAE